MNACQKNSVSCFACCGLANLDLPSDQKEALLDHRTHEFEKLNMDFSRFPEYRQRREKEEEAIPRHNSETYVCPFLGYLEPRRPGCMIHPARTGDPKSQNYSFYGASICLSYDCPAKDREEENGHSLYSDFLESSFPEQYHRLICDSELYSLLETIPDFPDSVCKAEKPVQWLIQLIKLRLKHPQSEKNTSFERLMVRATQQEAAVAALFRPEDRELALTCLKELMQLANRTAH